MSVSRLEGVIVRWAQSGIALSAAALPWERFQLIPSTEFTLVEVGAVMTILAGVASWLTSRGATFPRTRLWPCIALFFVAALVSMLRSADSGASESLVRTYVTYTAYFFALATFVTTPESALRMMRVFAVSAAGVAIVTLLAVNGLAWPARWDTAFWADQRLIQEFRDGEPMRITGAGLDFNQASLYLLIGLAVTLFTRGTSRAGTIVRLVASAVFVVSIAVSMSRSGVMIACALVLAAIVARTKAPYRAPAIVGSVVIAAFAAWLASDFSAMLATRAQGGFVYDEGSATNRAEVYRIALSLVPRHAVTGAGLGASRTAMEASEYGAQAVMAIHSMPLLLLIELGVLGFAAYFWLYWRFVQCGIRPMLAGPDPDTKSLGATLAAMTGAIFSMLLVQPLMVLPLYPFVLGLGAGPAASRKEGSTHLTQPFSRGVTAAAMLIALACVIENRLLFHGTASRTEAYADALNAGYRAERGGRWDLAESRYAAAAPLGANLSRASYFEEANALLDLGPLYENLGGAVDSDPEAVAWHAQGRVQLARGDYASAEASLIAAWSIDPRFSFMAFHLAEAQWASGHVIEAIAAYHAFGSLPSDENGPVDQLRSAFRRDDGNAGAEGADAWLEHATLARREGRWEDAARSAAEALAVDARCAEAHFMLGAQAELNGESAVSHYRRALDAIPNHRRARLALDRVTRNNP